LNAIEFIEVLKAETSPEPGIRVGRSEDGVMTDLALCAGSPDERRALLGQLLRAAASAGVGPGGL